MCLLPSRALTSSRPLPRFCPLPPPPALQGAEQTNRDEGAQDIGKDRSRAAAVLFEALAAPGQLCSSSFWTDRADSVALTVVKERGEAKTVRSSLCLPSAPDTMCCFSLAFPATVATQAGGYPLVNQDLCTAHCLLVD